MEPAQPQVAVAVPGEARPASVSNSQVPWWQTGKGIERLILGIVGLAIVVAVVGMLVTGLRVLPRLELAPSFRLVDQTGQLIQSNELRGNVVLYSFTYTGCEAACRSALDPVRGVQDRLASVTDGSIPVQLVTIALDPEEATPEALQLAAARHGAQPAVWRFVAPEATTARNLLGIGFRNLSTRNEDGSYRLVPLYVLVDGAGVVRARYEVTIPTTDQLLRDVKAVVDEARQSTGIGRYFYEAVHLFECSPIPVS